MNAKPFIATGFPKEEMDNINKFCELFPDYRMLPDEIRNIPLMEFVIYHGSELPKTYRIAAAMAQGIFKLN